MRGRFSEMPTRSPMRQHIRKLPLPLPRRIQISICKRKTNVCRWVNIRPFHACNVSNGNRKVLHLEVIGRVFPLRRSTQVWVVSRIEAWAMLGIGAVSVDRVRWLYEWLYSRVLLSCCPYNVRSLSKYRGLMKYLASFRERNRISVPCPKRS